jgi:hypothetical protein
MDLNSSDYGPVAEPYEHGTDTSPSIKGGEFLDQLSH